MGGYEDLASPVPASDMVYQNVARALIGTWSGVSNVVENPTQDNGKYSYTFSYTIPSDENRHNYNLIGVILDKSSGQVINSVKVPYSQIVSNKNVMPELVDFTLYPNPSSDYINVDFNLDKTETVSIYITDIAGRVVYKECTDTPMSSFNKSINISNLKNGVYLINIQTKEGVSAEKFVKQ
ncbi:MAG: T9SS type A sorting domain-containing protein [Saprospiraceae bacterium]